MSRPVRRVRRPSAPESSAAPTSTPASKRPVRRPKQAALLQQGVGQICPECELQDSQILSVKGTIGGTGADGEKMPEPAKLVTTYRCRACFHTFVLEKVRDDVCEHGRAWIVPCAACRRTWETIER